MNRREKDSKLELMTIEQSNMDIDIHRIEIYVVRAPIKNPVKTSFGIMNDRPSVLVRVEDRDGGFGWGEVWCNFPNCGAEHRALLLETVISQHLLGNRFSRPESAFFKLTEGTHVLALQTGEFGPLAQVIAGIDIALWDMVARRVQLPLYRLLGGRGNGDVPAYASGINPKGVKETFVRSRKAGYHAFKIKVGFGANRDLENIKCVIEELTASEVFMIDANQAWDLETAMSMAQQFGKFPISWLEEPIHADRPLKEWATLAKSSVVPLAAGENLRGYEMFTSAINSGTIAVFQPDVCKWGGITGCMSIALNAMKAGRRYCPHYLGGGIGLLASAHLLAAAGGDGLLEVDINPNPLRKGLAHPFPIMQDGLFKLTSSPGLGVEPDMSIVNDFLVKKREIF